MYSWSQTWLIAQFDRWHAQLEVDRLDSESAHLQTSQFITFKDLDKFGGSIVPSKACEHYEPVQGKVTNQV